MRQPGGSSGNAGPYIHLDVSPAANRGAPGTPSSGAITDNGTIQVRHATPWEIGYHRGEPKSAHMSDMHFINVGTRGFLRILCDWNPAVHRFNRGLLVCCELYRGAIQIYQNGSLNSSRIFADNVFVTAV